MLTVAISLAPLVLHFHSSHLKRQKYSIEEQTINVKNKEMLISFTITFSSTKLKSDRRFLTEFSKLNLTIRKMQKVCFSLNMLTAAGHGL